MTNTPEGRRSSPAGAMDRLIEELRAKAAASTRYKGRSNASWTNHVTWKAADLIEEMTRAPEGFVTVREVRAIFTRRLNLSYGQRAYSWHEIQDALAEVERKRMQP